MAETAKLAARPRQETGSRAATRLRATGQVPAIVYGHKQDPQMVAVTADEIGAAVRHGQRVLDLQLDGRSEKVLIKELQWDTLGRQILHVDFARVSADERLVVEVPVELRGVAVGTTEGGLLQQVLHTLEVECLATEIPDHLRVTITDLHKGQALHIRDLQPPPGVRILGEPELVVVQVTEPAAEVETEPTEPTTAEPEVIGRKAESEEGEEA